MQIVGQPQHHPEAAEACHALRNEWVVRVQGKLAVRQNPNPRIPTGNYEVLSYVSRIFTMLPFDHIHAEVAGGMLACVLNVSTKCSW